MEKNDQRVQVLEEALDKALALIIDRVRPNGFTQGQIANDRYQLGLKIKEIRDARNGAKDGQ